MTPQAPNTWVSLCRAARGGSRRSHCRGEFLRPRVLAAARPGVPKSVGRLPVLWITHVAVSARRRHQCARRSQTPRSTKTLRCAADFSIPVVPVLALPPSPRTMFSVALYRSDVGSLSRVMGPATRVLAHRPAHEINKCISIIYDLVPARVRLRSTSSRCFGRQLGCGRSSWPRRTWSIAVISCRFIPPAALDGRPRDGDLL